MIIQNAIIKKASLSTKNQGLLTMWLDLEFDGWAQGFGGYNLGSSESVFTKNGGNIAGHFIARVLKVADCYNFNELEGRCIRIKKDDEYSSPIHEIGHIVKDIWFNPKKEFSCEQNPAASSPRL